MVDLRIGDLFPPDGHRYLSAAEIEDLRQLALSADMLGPVGLTPREAMQIVCDLTNGIAEVEKLTARLVAAEAVVEAVREMDPVLTHGKGFDWCSRCEHQRDSNYPFPCSYKLAADALAAYDASVTEHDKAEGESDG